MYAQEISSSGFVPWCVRILLHTHTHTHTHITISQHITNNFLFTCNTIKNPETPTFVEFYSSIPTCVIVPSIFSTMEFWDSPQIPFSVKERVTKTAIFQQLSEGACCSEGDSHWWTQTIPFSVSWEQCRSQVGQSYSLVNLHLPQQIMGRP